MATDSFCVSQFIHEREQERHRREVTIELGARPKRSPIRKSQALRLLAPQGTPKSRSLTHRAPFRRLRQEVTLQSLCSLCNVTRETGREELRSLHRHKDTESKLLQRFLTTVERLQELDWYKPRLLPELYASRAAQEATSRSEWRAYWAQRPLGR